MADISFYKYLEAAFRHKLFKDTKATSFNFLGFNLPYETIEGKKGIFEYARRVLPSFYSLHFANTEEGHLQMAKDFLQKLDRKTDPELPKYFDPNQAPVEYEPVIKEAKIESAAPVAIPESPLPPPPVPKAPPTRRIIILPSSQEKEEEEKQPPTEPVATPPPQESGAPPPPTAGVPQPPSISFSTSVGQPPPEKKEKKREEKKKRWFGRLRSGGSLFDFLPIRQAASWIWRNMLRPVLNFAWRSILQPALRWLGSQAGRLLFQFLPRLTMGALNALAGLLGGIGGLSGIAFAAGSALFWGVIAVVSFVVVTILATFLSPFITTPTEPVQANYTLPLRNPNVSPHPQPIQDIITQTLPDPQVNNWQTIIDAAVANNWNPALLLTLWIEASRAQDKVDRVLVCDPDPAHPESALEINLRCFFKKYANYNDNEFPGFIKEYATLNAPGTDASQGYESYYNEAFLQRIRDWYSQMVLEGELGAITPITIPTGPTLDYKISLRNTSVTVAEDRVQITKDLVELSWSKSKVDEYWDHIVRRSTNEGWNPAFVLALWIEETGASERTVERMGGGNVPNEKGEFALGHLGCAPTEEQTIDESLNCLNNFFNLHFPNNSYTDDQFSKFMLIYSEGPGGVNFTKNPNFPFNFESWYLTLIPLGSPGAPEPVTPPVGVLASCPVPEGKIKTPSYQASPTTGHCSPSYGSCPPESRRAKSIDVDTKGGNVFFPKIDDQEVDWFYLNQFPLNNPTDCEGGRSDCGIGVVFQAKTGSAFWTLHLLHLDPKTTLPFDTAAPNRSGTAVGKTVSNVYVHINIGKDIKNASNPPQGDTDLNSGWLPADFMCQ